MLDRGAASQANVPPRRSPRGAVLLVILLLGIHTGLLVWGSLPHSPSYDEAGHLPAGLYHWQTGRFELYRVNPPLVRMVAALPVLFADPKVEWHEFSSNPLRRPEWIFAREFIEANGQWSWWLFSFARWACIPLSWLGAYVCFRWSRALYGDAAGVLAVSLWCFSPNILAHAQMITPDVGATALGVTAAYVLWHWLRFPSWGWALAAGVLLGLAQLTKASWLILFPLWPVLWVLWGWSQHRGIPWPGWRRQALQLAVILLLGVYLINLGYGFDGSFTRLDQYHFYSKALAGPTSGKGFSDQGGNRFAETWLGSMPVPFPKEYVQGLDRQKWEFDRNRWSYLRGAWRENGWWYYYLYALAIKVPVGTWGLVLLALLATLLVPGYSATRRDELFLLAPLIVFLLLVSSQTGFNKHMRYVLPVFPFAFIWMSKIARAVGRGDRIVASIAAGALSWSIASSLWVYPHSLSYFNEMVGGPTNGHAHLDGSNLDWGQDLLRLKHWVDRHPRARPLALDCVSVYAPKLVGIEYTPPPVGPDAAVETPPRPLGPRPGWYALSVRMIRRRSKEYDYFLNFEPVATAGYSICIYHVTLEQANRVRRQLGLPPLAPEGRGIGRLGWHLDQ